MVRKTILIIVLAPPMLFAGYGEQIQRAVGGESEARTSAAACALDNEGNPLPAGLDRTIPGGQNTMPPVPYEDRGACPFECCTYRSWKVTVPTAVHRDRQDSSPVVFSLRKGENVNGLTGVVITTRPGEVRVLRPFVVGGVRARSGETIYLLTYQGEGFYKVWYRGKIVVPEMGDAEVKHIKDPQSVWWVKVKNSRGQIGWTRQTKNFDGMDSCG